MAACVAAVMSIFASPAAMARAEHNTDIRNFEFSETDSNTCNGHLITWSGTFQIVDQFTANDRVVSFHTTTTFKGVQGQDLTTGETVHWVEAAAAGDGFIRDGQESRNVSMLQERWVTPGPANDMVIRSVFIYIIDANGIVEVQRGSFEISCV
jgi:hypothetical protein